jgi:hypothetical protein
VQSAEESLKVAKQSLTAARRMVEEGLRTNLYVLDSQDDVTRDETALVTSKIDYYLALVRLRLAIGLDISQDLPTERVEDLVGATEEPTEATEEPAEATEEPAGAAEEPAEATDMSDLSGGSTE